MPPSSTVHDREYDTKYIVDVYIMCDTRVSIACGIRGEGNFRSLT